MAIREAVTVVLLHGDQLLMTRRNPQLRAFPGYDAFPGGKVDATDGDGALPDAVFAGHSPRLVRALARELQEEVGFDLLAAARAGTVESVLCLGEATTPAFAPVRFRTWFYKITLAPDTPLPAVEHDPGELVSCGWASVTDWWDRYRAGNLLVAPPTMVVLRALAGDRGIESLVELNLDFDPSVETPWVEPVSGLRIMMVLSNTLPPAAHTNVFWFGGDGHPRIVVDPSPANHEELERMCTRVSEWGIDQVFLTHHHPDHREYANEVARRFKVPLGCSADTAGRIRAKSGAGWFKDLELLEYTEGDVLTHWQGEPVKLLAVPGHDEGQLAPMPRSRRWCIVSDLIQGVGTVVIAAPEGNMKKYFATLERVIDLNPAVIVPSHGLALGTTHYLRAALAHRQAREQAIAALNDAGRSEDEILGEIYRDVDPRLLPLARLNIRSHLEKLAEDLQSR